MVKTIPIFDPTRLRTLRELHDLSPESFGKKIGKTKVTVTSWERGKSLPGIDDLHKIGLAFKVNPLSFWVTPQEKVAS